MRTALVLLLCACAPPPEITVEPVIQFVEDTSEDTDGTSGADTDLEPIDIHVVSPPSSNADNSGPFEVIPASDGKYYISVVVDLQGITPVDPYEDPEREVVPREGHWHMDALTLSPAIVSFDRYAEFVVDPAVTTVTPPQLVALTVTMRDNDHAPKVVGGLDISDVVEIMLMPDPM